MFRLQLCFSSHTCCIVFQILYKVPDFNICCITVNDFLSLYAILYCFHSSKQCETLVYIKCLLGMSNSYYFCFKLKLCDAIVVDTVVHLHNCSNFFFFLQNLKAGLTLWKFGTLPPALIAFRGHVHGIDPSWHMLGLGYQESTDIESVKKAAVIHYNGQCKPWLDIAFKNLQPFWTKYVNYSNDFIRNCHILEPLYDR